MRKKSLFSGKKGLGVEQVFVFIIAALTFSLIMIFGYKAISGFLEKGELAEMTKFKNKLEGEVQQIYTEYLATRTKEYRLPAKYEQICFVDLDQGYDASKCARVKNPVACMVWEEANGNYERGDQNVFLYPPADLKIKLVHIRLSESVLCIPIVNGQFKLKLEGKGDSTEISPAGQ